MEAVIIAATCFFVGIFVGGWIGYELAIAPLMEDDYDA